MVVSIICDNSITIFLVVFRQKNDRKGNRQRKFDIFFKKKKGEEDLFEDGGKKITWE